MSFQVVPLQFATLNLKCLTTCVLCTLTDFLSPYSLLSISHWLLFPFPHWQDVMELEDHRFIESVQEQVEGALLEYTLCTSTQYLGRFAHLLLCLSELRPLSILAEEYLSCKHLSAEVPCNNLLIEMLHAKHSWPWRRRISVIVCKCKHNEALGCRMNV